MARQIYIENANYINDYTIQLNFNDGSARTIDFSHFLKTRPLPQRLRVLDRLAQLELQVLRLHCSPSSRITDSIHLSI